MSFIDFLCTHAAAFSCLLSFFACFVSLFVCFYFCRVNLSSILCVMLWCRILTRAFGCSINHTSQTYESHLSSFISMAQIFTSVFICSCFFVCLFACMLVWFFLSFFLWCICLSYLPIFFLRNSDAIANSDRVRDIANL